jgi:hypothetical protein
VPDSVSLAVAVLQRHLDRPPRRFLRVERGGYFLRDCTTVGEVAELVDLATLTETVDLRRATIRRG